MALVWQNHCQLVASKQILIFHLKNDLIQTLDIDSTIGHLYFVDIEFDCNNATQNQITCNEIYSPIIGKQKIIDPCETSIYQLLEQHWTTEKGKPRSYKATKKAHATMFKKNFQLMHCKQMFFPVVRAGWKVTKIYLHYTYEQERYKRDFILMNQKWRQNAKCSVEKDFYKLMNNSNFGYDCRNNLDNCQYVPIFSELKEITIIKKFYNFFDPKVSTLVTSDLIVQEIEEKYNDDMIKVSEEDQFYKVKKPAADTEKAQALESLKEFNKKNIRKKKKRTLYDYLDRQEELTKITK